MKLSTPITQYLCPEQVIKSEKLNVLQKLILIFMFNNFSGKLSVEDLSKFTGAKVEVIKHEISDLVTKGIIEDTGDSFNVKQEIVFKMGYLPEVKKKKPVIEKKDFVAPTLRQWVDYFLENGYRKDVAETSWKAYHEAQWTDSRGKPIFNWKQKAINVWFKEENKQAGKQKAPVGNGGFNV